MLRFTHLQHHDQEVLRRSWTIRNRYGFSIWDSQILAAALAAGCSTLLTEDLQHGQRIEGLEIINPLMVD